MVEYLLNLSPKKSDYGSVLHEIQQIKSQNSLYKNTHPQMQPQLKLHKTKQ